MDTCANPGERLLLLLNCYCNYTKYVTREAKDQSESERSASVYEKSYDVFCKGVIETEVIGDKKIMYLKDILKRNLLPLLKSSRMWMHLNVELLNSSND